MEVNFKDPASTQTVTELAGITKEKIIEVVKDFEKELNANNIKNNSELIVFAAKKAETVEEAIIYTHVLTRAIESARKKNPLQQLVEVLRSISEDTKNEEKE